MTPWPRSRAPRPPTPVPEQARAQELARVALAKHLKIAEDGITVSQSTSRTWNDSSMGCGKPGAVALTVITEGYAVVLGANGKQYQVHVSGDNAVVCDKGSLTRQGGNVNVRGLDVMMEKARQDLAQRIGAEPAKIRLEGFKPKQFADSGLGCPADGETLTPGPIDGFLVMLKHAGRVYTYHTDRKTVRPCPGIEAQ